MEFIYWKRRHFRDNLVVAQLIILVGKSTGKGVRSKSRVKCTRKLDNFSWNTSYNNEKGKKIRIKYIIRKRKVPLIGVWSLAERRSRERSEKRRGKAKAEAEREEKLLFLLSIFGFHSILHLSFILITNHN